VISIRAPAEGHDRRGDRKRHERAGGGEALAAQEDRGRKLHEADNLVEPPGRVEGVEELVKDSGVPRIGEGLTQELLQSGRHEGKADEDAQQHHEDVGPAPLAQTQDRSLQRIDDRREHAH
jgi:hypothetical protein